MKTGAPRNLAAGHAGLLEIIQRCFLHTKALPNPAVDLLLVPLFGLDVLNVDLDVPQDGHHLVVWHQVLASAFSAQAIALSARRRNASGNVGLSGCVLIHALSRASCGGRTLTKIGFAPVAGRPIRFLTLATIRQPLTFGYVNVEDDDPADKRA
jgi:hypothetical protein